MKEYVLTLITVSVVAGIALSFIDNDNLQLKKRLNFVVGLICAIALLSPIVATVNNFSEVKNSITSFVDSFDGDNSKVNQIIVQTGVEKISEGIKCTIADKFDIEDTDIKVSLALNKENIESVKIESITVSLFGKATWLDEYEIKKYAEEYTGCKTNVIKR